MNSEQIELIGRRMTEMSNSLAAQNFALLLVMRTIANNMPGAADDLEKSFDEEIDKHSGEHPGFTDRLKEIRGLIRNPPEKI